jgi:hypothetical protein
MPNKAGGLTGQSFYSGLSEDAVRKPEKFKLWITGLPAKQVTYHLGKTSDEDYTLVGGRRFLRNLTELEETDNIRLWLWYNVCREFRRHIWEQKSIEAIWTSADTADRAFICRKLFEFALIDMTSLTNGIMNSMFSYEDIKRWAIARTPYKEGWD